MTYLLPALQMFTVLLFAPLMVGLVRMMKARLQNRRGASVLQPYWALLSLIKKEMTITRYGSWVFRTVPFVVLGVALMLALIVPTLAATDAMPGIDNVFFVAAVIALGAVFLVFGGMDTASTFGNMGSSREMTLAALVEPAFILVLATLGLLAGSWSLGGIVSLFAGVPIGSVVPLACVSLLALLLIVLAENARYPVDNPATHLELTMVHEAMVLEYSGPYLAMLEYASAIKLTVMTTFLATLLLPIGIAQPAAGWSIIAIALGVFLAKLVVGAAAIALIETVIVKMRFYRMQEYMALALLLAALGLAIVLIGLHA